MSNVTAVAILSIAQNWSTNGMFAAGYNWICTDDGWQQPYLDVNSNLIVGPWFGDMTNFCLQVHMLGGKVQSYVNWGLTSCAGFTNGSQGNEVRHLGQVRGWGWDGIKVDACSSSAPLSDEQVLRLWSELTLPPNGYPLHLLMSSSGYQLNYTYIYVNDNQNSQGASLISTYPESSLVTLLTRAIACQVSNTYAPPSMGGAGFMGRPGAYRDDFCVNGLAPTNICQWAVSYAAMYLQPLVLEYNVNSNTLPIWTNPEAMEIMDDPLQIQATNSVTNGVFICVKQLQDPNQKAFWLVSTNLTTSTNVVVNWNQYGFTNSIAILDIWNQTNLPAVNGNDILLNPGALPPSTFTIRATNQLFLKVSGSDTISAAGLFITGTVTTNYTLTAGPTLYITNGLIMAIH